MTGKSTLRAGALLNLPYTALVLGVLLLGLVIHAPSLEAGYLADDYLQHAMLEGRYPVERSALDLYSFARKPGELGPLIDGGVFAWWSHPDVSLSALRPLSSALTALDHRLELSPWARHVHSLVWWAALVVAYAWLVRSLLPPVVAAIAVVLFALDSAHTVPIAWLANRATLISAVFGVLALLGHVHFRERGLKSGAVLSATGTMLALAAGEYGLCAVAYIFCYELVVIRDSWARRWPAIALPGVPALAYAVIYVSLGYGPSATSMYVDPLRAPGRFLSDAAAHFPMLLVDEVLDVPSDFSLRAFAVRDWRLLWWLVPLAAVGLLLAGSVRRLERRLQKTLLFLLLGMLLSLLPLVGTVPSTRILTIPSVGGSALIATLLWDAAGRLFNRAQRRRPQFWLRFALSALVAPLHLVLAPWMSHAMAVDKKTEYIARHAGLLRMATEHTAQQNFIVLNAVDPMAWYVALSLATERLPTPRSWNVLALTQRPIHVRRTAANAFELRVDEGALLENPLAYVFRLREDPLHEGETIKLQHFLARVLKTSPDNPVAVEFRLNRSLDDPSLVLLAPSMTGFFRVAPPAVGSEIVIYAPTGSPPQLASAAEARR